MSITCGVIVFFMLCVAVGIFFRLQQQMVFSMNQEESTRIQSTLDARQKDALATLKKNIEIHANIMAKTIAPYVFEHEMNFIKALLPLYIKESSEIQAIRVDKLLQPDKIFDHRLNATQKLGEQPTEAVALWPQKAEDHNGFITVWREGDAVQFDRALPPTFGLSRLLHLEYPVIHEEMVIAEIHIYYSDTAINRRIETAKASSLDDLRASIEERNKKLVDVAVKQLIAITLVVLLLMGSIIISLRRIVVFPLGHVLHGVRQIIDNSNMKYSVKVHSNDEVGQLAMAFNHMTATVSDLMGKLQSAIDEVTQKNAEIKQLNQMLELKVADRTKDLEHARSVAIAADRSKSEFLANMSHEIRTPMNAIIGIGQLLKKTPLNLKQRDYLEKIQQSSQILLRIINDILDLSKIEAGKLEIEKVPFDLDELMINFSNLIIFKAREKNLDIFFDIDPQTPCLLLGDPLRLEQILLNITNNAVKFTEKGEVVISVHSRQADGDEVDLHFAIRDTGVGMGEDQQARLFQAFEQADASTTRKFGGTGLGLVICKRLVEMMGGHISVQSEYGKGSTFLFNILLTKQSSECIKRAIVPAELENLKVLVVDNNATSRNIFRKYLKDFGFEIHTVRSAEAAVKEIKTTDGAISPYHLVIVNYIQPGSGVSAICKEVSSMDPQFHRPKVIMVIDYGQDSVMNEKKEAGVSGFLFKPITQSSVLDAIVENLVDGSERRKITSRTHQWDIPENLDTIRGARILLVEDNSINQQVAATFLEDEGFFVSIAENGQEAVDMVKETTAGTPFDLVLMDLQMPVMDGYEATRQIRSDERFDALPIIAMTADALRGTRERVIKVGMNDYVSKPINTRTLFESMLRRVPPRERPLPEAYRESLQSRSKSDPKSETQFSNRTIKGIDIDEALLRAGGKDALFIELLQKFMAHHHDTDSQIQRALKNNAWDEALRHAHTVKSVSGNIGAIALAERAAKLEVAIQNSGIRPSDTMRNESKDEMDIPSLLQDFSTDLAHLIENIEIFLSQMNNDAHESKVSKTSDPEQWKHQLNALRTFLEDDDGEALDIVNEMMAAAPDNINKADLIRLKERVEQFEFEEALEMLEQMTLPA